MEWTEETIERLRSLWQEGLSTAEIGRRMSITKNAVVGKAHRLVLSARPSPIRKVPRKDGDQSRSFKSAARPAGEAPGEVAQFVPRLASTPPVDQLPGAGSAAPIDTDGINDNVMPLRAAQASAARLAQAMPAVPVRAARPALDADVDQPGPRHEPNRTANYSIGEPVRHGRSQSCCWPLGDPGTKQFRFCGGEPIPGKPYCVEHAQLAYVKLRDRRDTVA